MNILNDDFDIMFEEYLNNKIHNSHKLVSCLYMPEDEYRNKLKEFYEELVHLNLYHVILLHYVNQSRLENNNRKQIFEKTDKKILGEIRIQTTSKALNLQNFCKWFDDLYGGSYEDTKKFTINICWYISSEIYGLQLPLAKEHEYFNNNQNFAEVVNSIIEHIQNNAHSIDFTSDELVAHILPCVLHMYLDAIYTLSTNTTVGQDIFLYNYQKYVLNSFDNCRLMDNQKDRNSIIVYMFRKYYDFLLSSLQPHKYQNQQIKSVMSASDENSKDLINAVNNKACCTEKDAEVYSEKDLYEEALNIQGNKAKFVNDEFIIFCKEHKKLYELFLKCINKPEFVLYKVNESDVFSNIVAYAVIGLYFSGKRYAARQFLLLNNNHICTSNIDSVLFFIFIVRCIIECKDYITASRIYGLYFKFFAQNTKSTLISYTGQMIENILHALDIAKEEFANNERYKKVYGLLLEKIYKNEQLIVFLKECDKNIKDKKPLKYTDFKKLQELYYEFSKKDRWIDIYKLKTLLEWDDDYCQSVYTENDSNSKIFSIIEFTNSFLDKYISPNDENAGTFYYTSKRNATKLVGYELQNHVHSLEVTAIINENKNFKNKKEKILNNHNGNEQQHEIEKMCKRYGQELLKVSGNNNEALYVANVKNSQKKFLEKYVNKENAEGNLIEKKLPEGTRELVMEYMITADAIYNYLNTLTTTDCKFDFSPACLPLTKALETILGYIWEKSSKNIKTKKIESKEDKDKYCYCINNEVFLKKRLELGPYAYMFQKDWFISNVDFNKLTKMSDEFYNKLKLPIDVGRNNCVEQACFKKQSEKNAEIDNKNLVTNAILYVTKKYRNQIAHREPFNKTTAEKCREYLISTQQLLWILLYIMPDI